MPGFDVPGWYAFFVPAKTPPEIVRKMLHRKPMHTVRVREAHQRRELLQVPAHRDRDQADFENALRQSRSGFGQPP